MVPPFGVRRLVAALDWPDPREANEESGDKSPHSKGLGAAVLVSHLVLDGRPARP